MASDQLRKKWGTIFMGERETSPQQLDAMQEPLLRERAQHQQQEDYLARVRARAEERAREILGAAYAERQKVLEEAGGEAQAKIQQLTQEARALKAQAQGEMAAAHDEHEKARELRDEAEFIRNNAHNNGFQAGMEQAGAELKEFRADVGQMLGNTLLALEAQRHALVEDWRDELAELARVAVEAGTGWVLQTEHQNVLQHLVFSSLQLLENRSTVTLRVHPDDEETVSDLFRAARERVPELNQWIVNGDASIELGGLVAESASGSVENLRAHYREMVNGILEHLTLPQGAQEGQAAQAASEVSAQELARLAEVVPPRPVPAGEMPVLVDDMPEGEAGPGAEQESGPESVEDSEPPQPGDPEQGAVLAMGSTASNDAAPVPADAPADPAVHNFDAGAQPDDGAAPMRAPEAALLSDAAPVHDEPPASAHPAVPAAPEPVDPAAAGQAAPKHGADNVQQPANEHSADVQPTFAAEPQAPQQADAHGRQVANPSLAELEDELFPLPEEEKIHAAQPDSSVFVSGGFLPGSGNGQPE
ncbi:flagellar assembly protein FliH [Desulfovibrio desulfuricans]|uniref:Flagellar assembly protein FliH n=1 Tax=Desulfovibrio desulfuricans TaxID=876 RepID=A0A4P7UP18_DESDE|nr:FliH/SctL family protein [Desulfovibrio desulfuricans]QCC85342.1 flagellar assembly protein FliH [Desulfovibrio desulfuricans]